VIHTIRPDWNKVYRGSPPWDIGRPQPAFEALAKGGEIRPGAVLDIGCGTGDNAIMLAQRGCTVTGIDLARDAVRHANAKAAERRVPASFTAGNALALDRCFGAGAFDAAIDSGLFHVLADAERPVFARQVCHVLKPGGRYFMLCFSDKERGEYELPRRVSRREIEATFGKLLRINYIREAWFLSQIGEMRHQAYLLSAMRV
jgi:cyclopropane fatty-acyl-phospholipid synthase-like methyltransferase